MGAVTVNPIQDTTYTLRAAINSTTFGSATDITAPATQIAVYGDAATVWNVTNLGVLKGGWGVYLQSKSSVTNTGTISATIDGVFLHAGGTVINQAGGAIGASGGFGVDILGGSGAVTNSGSIAGGIDLTVGGAVTNETFGKITGAVAVGGGSATVSNLGTIAGAVTLAAGGKVTNFIGATIDNVSGPGVSIAGALGSLSNRGTITGGGAGAVSLAAGDTLNNASGGVIDCASTANYCVYGAGGAVMATNAGTITGGVKLAGGSLNNTGAIAGGRFAGVSMGGGGTVVDSGSIGGTVFGVRLTAGGRLIENAGAKIGAATARPKYGFVGETSVTDPQLQATILGVLYGAAFAAEFLGPGAHARALGQGFRIVGDVKGSTTSGATNTITVTGAGNINGNVVDFQTAYLRGGVSTIHGWQVGRTDILAGDGLFDGAATTDITIASLAEADVAAAGSLTLTGVSSDSGVVKETGAITLGETLGLGPRADFYVMPLGMVEMLGDNGIGRGLSTASTIHNSGLIEKIGGKGVSVIAPNIANAGTIEVLSGALELRGLLSGTGAVRIVGGPTLTPTVVLKIDGAVGLGQSVTFAGAPNGELILDDLGSGGHFLGRIAGFAAGDAIDLGPPFATAATGPTTSFAYADNGLDTGGVLTLTFNTPTPSHAALHFVGDYEQTSFHMSSDGRGGTLLTYA